ncbi:hypothetical protein LP420_32670 [Massilia sp. B-10]|nr:hypothetical protein LP420_32670 [Massilia sp. B-10]
MLGETSNRNLGDAASLLLDVRNGELIRADFAGNVVRGAGPGTGPPAPAADRGAASHRQSRGQLLK